MASQGDVGAPFLYFFFVFFVTHAVFEVQPHDGSHDLRQILFPRPATLTKINTSSLACVRADVDASETTEDEEEEKFDDGDDGDDGEEEEKPPSWFPSLVGRASERPIFLLPKEWEMQLLYRVVGKSQIKRSRNLRALGDSKVEAPDDSVQRLYFPLTLYRQDRRSQRTQTEVRRKQEVISVVNTDESNALLGKEKKRSNQESLTQDQIGTFDQLNFSHKPEKWASFISPTLGYFGHEGRGGGRLDHTDG